MTVASPVELGEKRMQIAPCEGPPEGFGGLLIASLECHQLALQIGQAVEAARRQQFPLNEK